MIFIFESGKSKCIELHKCILLYPILKGGGREWWRVKKGRGNDGEGWKWWKVKGEGRVGSDGRREGE